MTDSPISATPYEVLGVSPTVDFESLRRAYRRRLRETHPDVGGSPAEFHAVQRAWERIGTPEDRAVYDRGMPSSANAPAAPRARSESRPVARSYGHPGGWRRERYLVLIREWAGRGVAIDDPYDPALVRSAPKELRHLLADALAEEATARAISELGIAYTAWHDVATGGSLADAKLDHVVLGPTGLYAILSEDWGAPVTIKRGELMGEGLAAGEEPVRSLAARAKSIAKAAKVAFTALVVVVPDDATEQSFAVIGRSRGAVHVLVQRSFLPGLLRSGLPDTVRPGGTELFELRTRLQSTIRFV